RLAWGLIDSMIAEDAKCIVVDITGQYAVRFGQTGPETRSSIAQSAVREATRAFAGNVGLDDMGRSGSETTLRSSLGGEIEKFVQSDDPILVLDPMDLCTYATKAHGFPRGDRANLRQM